MLYFFHLIDECIFLLRWKKNHHGNHRKDKFYIKYITQERYRTQIFHSMYFPFSFLFRLIKIKCTNEDILCSVEDTESSFHFQQNRENFSLLTIGMSIKYERLFHLSNPFNFLFFRSSLCF